jgi:hypothetical protein
MKKKLVFSFSSWNNLFHSRIVTIKIIYGEKERNETTKFVSTTIKIQLNVNIELALDISHTPLFPPYPTPHHFTSPYTHILNLFMLFLPLPFFVFFLYFYNILQNYLLVIDWSSSTQKHNEICFFFFYVKHFFIFILYFVIIILFCCYWLKN